MLNNTLNIFQTWLSRFELFERNNGIFKTAVWVGISVSLLSIFFYSPHFYFHYRTNFLTERGADFLRFKEKLFDAKLEETILYYRFLLPAIAHYLHFNTFFSFLFPYITGIVSLSFLYVGLRKKIDSKVALLLVVLISFSYHTTGHRFNGFADNVSHLFSSILLISTNPFLIITSSLLGLLNDERFIVTLPFILLWHYPNLILKQNLVKSAIFSFYVFIALGIYILVRMYVTQRFNIETPVIYNQIKHKLLIEKKPWKGSWFLFFLNVFMGFRFIWFFVLQYFLNSKEVIRKFSTLSYVYFSFFFLMGLASMLSIGDVSRSTGYLYTCIIVGFLYVYQISSSTKIVRTLLYILVLLLITPMFMTSDYYGVDSKITIIYTYPLVLDLYRLFTGI